MSSTRTRVAQLLEPTVYNDRMSRAVDLCLILLIALNIIAVILGSVPEVHSRFEALLYWFEAFSITVFSIEYGLRIWSCVEVDKADEVPFWRQRVSYFFSPMAIIDLMAILPFYLGLIVSADLRFLRVLRILRILKLTRYSMAMQLIFRVFREEQRSFIAAFSILFALLIIAASGIYLIERDVQPDEFGSILESMWWAMATLTTVGYGDVTPITPGGKFFGGLVTIVSMGMVALPAGILASGFNIQMHRRRQKFNVLLKQFINDGVVTEQEWSDLEALRRELDLDEEEAELLIALSEARKNQQPECPHCGGQLHPLRRKEDE